MLDNIIRFFRRIKNAFILVFYICFSASICSNIVSPRDVILIAPFGLVFIPLFIINIIILLVYLRRNKWIAIASFVFLICSWPYFSRSFTYHHSNFEKGLKVMSWNVKNFDLYNWTKNLETKQKMFDLIDTLDADVLCFQEFFTDQFTHNNIRSIQRLGYRYYCFIPSISQQNTGNQWGLAIFSKYPITNAHSLHINPNNKSMNQCIRADITYRGQKYAIYNAHLQSIHFDYTDYDYIQDVKQEWKMIDFLKSKNIISKIILAYKNRTSQVEKLTEKISQSESQKTILCCDLNDVPNSYAYYRLESILSDSYRAKGKWFSNTTSIILPFFRIDYIFAHPSMTIYSYQRIRTRLSDHHVLVSCVE